MIIVTGATGKLGGQIVDALLAEMPATDLGVSVRSPADAIELARRGVRVRYGDFSDAQSLASAFEGATQLLIVSSNARASGGDPLAQHRAAIDAASVAGARRIVYTSHLAVSATSAFAPMHDHAATEVMLRDCGMAWTALRHGFYASTMPMLIGDAVASGVLAAPADGKVSWTAHCDLAAGAAAVLLQEGRFDGPTPPLTAGKALDLADVTVLLAELYERRVERTMISDAAYVDQMTSRGVPPIVADITLGIYRAARAGEFAAVDPTLAELIGRAPLQLRDLLTETKKASL